MLKTLGVVLLLAVAAAAQGPPRAYFPWWESRLTERLDLSEEQHTRIRAILKQYRDQMIDQRGAVEKADAEIEDLFAEQEIDQEHARRTIDRLVTARGEMTRSLTVMSLELRQVLTADQWRRLRELQDKRRDQFMRRRQGPPRGPRGSREPRRPDQPQKPSRPPEPEQL